jgi:hypothetical protein
LNYCADVAANAKVTDADARWRAILAFCDVVVREQLGPVAASKFLAGQMQSSDENTALRALDVLDTCVRRCGPRFQVSTILSVLIKTKLFRRNEAFS